MAVAKRSRIEQAHAALELLASVGSRGDGGAVEARLRELGQRLIPPEPVVPPVEVPEPRRLTSELTEPQRVEFLAAAYRAVVARRYSVKSNYMARGQLDVHAHYVRLVALSSEMLEAGVAPLAWVIFSFDRWRQSAKGASGRSPPPTKWVWSKKRWREAQAWFREERYVGVELRATPLARELYADWRALWTELMIKNPSTRQEVAAVVDRYFPGRSWEERLLSARQEQRVSQARVDREVANGGWPYE